MTHILTLFEVMEIRELLSLKITSLRKSKLFFSTVKDQNNSAGLQADIDLSTQEITDLENVLIYAAI